MQEKSRLLKVRRAFCLALPLLLLTGCPHNQYIVELAPRGSVIERKLEFYCEDGTDTNGLPKYLNFDTNELAEIARLYPPGAVKENGERYVAIGDFRAKMPKDIGGAGAYTNLATTLGSAGFYMERFRGDDDLATRTARRLRAADQFADLIIGWSRMELGRERNYEHLRRFLDNDFRKDVKNLSLYLWLLQISASGKPAAPEEFGVRFGQYLMERGYLKIEDLPEGFCAARNDPEHSRWLTQIMQRTVAAKLGIPKTKPIPASLEFLNNPDRAWKSWEDYLCTTDVYRAKLRHWQKEKVVSELGVFQRRIFGSFSAQSRTNSSPPPGVPGKPQPSEVTDELFKELIDFDLGTDDHVKVRLTLAAAPDHTNGKWDEARKQVLWDEDMERPDGVQRVPTFCYANWSTADEVAQKERFGKVILTGDDLAQYCLWRAALSKSEAAEWDGMLAGLHPGLGLKDRLETFRFSAASAPRSTNSPATDASALARDLILAGLKEKK